LVLLVHLSTHTLITQNKLKKNEEEKRPGYNLTSQIRLYMKSINQNLPFFLCGESARVAGESYLCWGTFIDIHTCPALAKWRRIKRKKKEKNLTQNFECIAAALDSF
jgi:hypothetical protein